MNNYVAPSHLKNYIFKDPIIDFLEYYKINKIDDKPCRKRSLDVSNNIFEEFIKTKGIEYENNVMKQFLSKCYYIIDTAVLVKV